MTAVRSRRELILAAIRTAAVALLAAQFLFAHGCHGDEDNELIVSLPAEATFGR